MSRIAFIIFLTLGLLLTACDDSSTEPNEIPRFMVLDMEPSWSPDGERIIYYHRQFYDCEGNLTPDTSGLYMIKSDGSNKTLFIPGFFNNPDWAPDGEWVAFGSGAQIFKIKSDGDSLAQLTFQGRNFFPAWSPDRQTIAYSRSICAGDTTCGLWVTDFVDSKNSFLVEYANYPDWHPTGNKILYSIRAVTKLGNVLGDSLWLFDLEDSRRGGMERLTDMNYDNRYFKYSQDGEMILFVSQPYASFPQLWKMGSDGENWKSNKDKMNWNY